jgi:type II secretory pathway predicted ATPase ExeA
MSQWQGYSPDNVLSDTGVSETGPQSAASAGTLTYEPFYGLKGKPFSLSTDPRPLYRSPIHTSVLDDLLAGIRRREGLVVLTGEMGTGKTTLCRAALYQLDRKTFTTFVPDPNLSREDLLRMLLVDFGEVSIDDLRRGRLSGASRPDLSYQLYEFLTSLESVDAFAVLVIDEAQQLAPPLLDEIRALSELEAGRRLLQIVLVGQPELQWHLKQPQMRQIDSRVTTRCELRPLTQEDVAGYVAHRLAMAGGASERIAFASAAIEMIHAASKGVPRLVNIICDRALSRAHGERTSVVGPPLVADAIDELQLSPRPRHRPAAPTVQPEPLAAPVTAPRAPTPHLSSPVAAPAVSAPPVSSPANSQGLFERRKEAPSAPAVSELNVLLDLPTTSARRDWAGTSGQAKAGASAAPVWKWRVDSEVRREARFAWLKSVGLAVLGMAVVLGAGGIALTAQRVRPVSPAVAPSVPAATAQPLVTVPLPVATAPVAKPAAQQPQAPASVPETNTDALAAPAAPMAAVAPLVSQDTWVVQVAAFASAENSQVMVQRLTRSGFPAFESISNGSGGAIHIVRVGPFTTAAEADDARMRLRELSDLDGAFVRSVTTR